MRKKVHSFHFNKTIPTLNNIVSAKNEDTVAGAKSSLDQNPEAASTTFVFVPTVHYIHHSTRNYCLNHFLILCKPLYSSFKNCFTTTTTPIYIAFGARYFNSFFLLLFISSRFLLASNILKKRHFLPGPFPVS